MVKKGYTILDRNYSCRTGEIDIIAKDDSQTIVFTEVKARNSKCFGMSGEAVTKEKQRKIIQCAKKYILDKGLSYEQNFRFDVILFDGGRLTYIEDAFCL